MSASTGNKYAEKWTLERTLSALKTIDSYSCSSDCLYLGHALQVAGYYNDIWAYWRRKWRSCYQVINAMNRIMQRFEVRLFDKMCNRQIPVQAAMFALKHHYGWGREKEVEIDTQYIENEPAPEEKPQPEEKHPETVKFEKNMIMDSTTAQEINNRMIQEYNAANPYDPIVTSATFFEGEPPANSRAVKFKDGFFMKY